MTDLHDTAAERLAADKQRYTARRRALVELLASVDQPLTIPQLLERQPDMAQSSVYRNLAVLEAAGVVHRIVTSDEFARARKTVVQGKRVSVRVAPGGRRILTKKKK